MSNLNPGGLIRVLNYIKTWVTGLLNGKANSSHTHTKSQITDFPAYGSTAGTICQGNDSRLSDARTPYFANGTWYSVGDDAAIGDHNVGGGLGVKALNSTTTRIDLCYKDDASNYKSITYDGTTLYMNGNCNYANSAGSASSATTAETVSTSVAADSSKALVYSSMADNDFCRILVGGSSNAGYVEIATADDGNEPIYVRQYTGVFSTVTRTLTLLDGSGNTQFPGTVTATTFSGNLNGNCNYANSAGSSSIAIRDSGGTWISGRDNAVVKQTRHSTEDGNSWNPAVSVKTKNGNWTIGTVGYDKLQFSYDTDEDYNTGNNRNTVVELNPESGTIITSANIGSQSVNYATNSGYTNWLRTSSHTDHLFHTEWDGSSFWTYVTAGDGGYRAVRVERSNYADSAGKADYLGDIGSTDRNGASGTGWYSVGFSYSYDEGHNELAINNYWGIRLNCRDSNHVTINGSRINVEDNTYLNGYRVYVG